MGGPGGTGFDVQQQQIIIQTVKDSPMWIKIAAPCLAAIGAAIVGWFLKRKK